jgi:hypothetical protein
MLLLASADGLGWTQVAVALLGSSAIGAVVGGSLTTVLRGQIEREEAWRTRMIEAADNVASALSQADLDFNAILIGDVAEARLPLHESDGALSKTVANSIRVSMKGTREANKLLSRVELLYGHDSMAYQQGLGAIYTLSGSIRLLEGNVRAQRAVRAVLAARRGDAEERDRLIARDEVADRRYQALISAKELPEDFDPEDGPSVAAWALLLHDAAVRSFRLFIKGAQEASRARHPGRAMPKLRGRGH